jgi:hypothetical protein
MIPASELAKIRMDAANAALDLPCTIQRKTITKDNLGQATEVWNTIATCNVGMTQPSQQLLQNYDFMIGSLSAWQVKFPYGTNVAAQDHLLITGQFAQQVLVVQVILEPRSYAALLTILASEVKPEHA